MAIIYDLYALREINAIREKNPNLTFKEATAIYKEKHYGS